MAIKHGYPILPCASVGTEDMLDIVMDLPISFMGVSTLPLVRSSPCKIQKVYFWFGDPIFTEKYKNDFEKTDNAKQLRDEVKAAVEAGIRELQAKQAADPDRFLMQQLQRKLRTVQGKATASLRASLDGKTD